MPDKNDFDLYEFEGMNCDDCGGWDGESRRCECGNRRVDWQCINDDCKCEYADMKSCPNAYGCAW